MRKGRSYQACTYLFFRRSYIFSFQLRHRHWVGNRFAYAAPQRIIDHEYLRHIIVFIVGREDIGISPGVLFAYPASAEDAYTFCCFFTGPTLHIHCIIAENGSSVEMNPIVYLTFRWYNYAPIISIRCII